MSASCRVKFTKPRETFCSLDRKASALHNIRKIIIRYYSDQHLQISSLIVFNGGIFVFITGTKPLISIM
jgi:hypothetical protein